MRRLKDDGLEKVKQGRTSMAEVARVVNRGANEPDRLQPCRQRMLPIMGANDPWPFEYSEILLEVVKRRASDLHLTAGVAADDPLSAAVCVRLDDYPA